MGDSKKGELIEIIYDSLMPAQGCTDPVSVAFASASAKRELNENKAELLSINIKVNANLYKNAARVIIPGTNDSGVVLAAALGYVVGEADKNLKVLEKIKSSDIQLAKKIVDKGIIEVEIDRDIKRLYIDLEIKTSKEKIRVVILDYYTNVVEIENSSNIGDFEVDNFNKTEKMVHPIEKYDLEDFINFSESVDLSKLKIIQDGIDISNKLAQEGLENKNSMANMINSMLEYQSPESKLLQFPSILTSAASEARMTGSSLPAMSLAGSGNQGITAFLTVIGAAKALESDEESRLRALVLSILITVYVKSKLGVLTAMCGAAVAAGFGASAGIVYLLGGDERNIFQAALNLYGTLTGIICDGAKLGCAYKVSVSSSWAAKAAILAYKDIGLDPSEGMLANNFKELIENLALLNGNGMEEADKEVLDILLRQDNASNHKSIGLH